MTHIYFPTTSIVSLLYVMQNGASAEIAVVGNDGLVGISLFMGGDTTSNRAVVQSAGHAFRLPTRFETGIRRRRRSTPASALHAGPDHPDGADGSL